MARAGTAQTGVVQRMLAGDTIVLSRGDGCVSVCVPELEYIFAGSARKGGELNNTCAARLSAVGCGSRMVKRECTVEN